MVDCTQESHVIFQTKFHGFGNKLFFLRTRTTYSELKTQAISFAIAQASSRKATPLRGINLPTYIILNGGPSWRLIEMIQVSALIPISVHKTDRCILTPCYLDNPSFHNLRTWQCETQRTACYTIDQTRLPRSGNASTAQLSTRLLDNELAALAYTPPLQRGPVLLRTLPLSLKSRMARSSTGVILMDNIEMLQCRYVLDELWNHPASY